MSIDILTIKPNVIDPSINGKVFWFYGEPGTRKTSVGVSFPDALLLATERGYKFINGVKKVDIAGWNDVRNIYKQLKSPEAQEMYKTLVFDRADTLYEYCKEFIVKMYNSNLKENQQPIKEVGDIAYSAGYAMARREYNSVIKGLESLGYGLVFITHDKVDMEKVTKQDLENNAAKVLRGYTDFIFLLRKENVNGKDTVMAYSQMIGADSKSRARYFTPSFEFTYENLQKELKIAIEKQIQMDGIEVAVQGKMKEETRSFEEVRDSVIALYTNLVQSEDPRAADAAVIINGQMQGTKLSQATEKFLDNLLVIETYLLSLEG